MSAIKDVAQIPDIFAALLANKIRLVKLDVGKLLIPKHWGWRFVAFDLRMPVSCAPKKEEVTNKNNRMDSWWSIMLRSIDFLQVRCVFGLKNSFSNAALVMFDTHKIYERWRQRKVGAGVDERNYRQDKGT